MERDPEKKTLLLVDDVELFIQLQISHLGRQRYDIHTANCGSEGLRIARALRPDLILLDLYMTDMNGDQVCRILKGDPETNSIPVILVSSGAAERSKAATLTSNCDGLIFKPVRRDLLLSVVENLLGTNLRLSERIYTSIPGTATLDGNELPITIRSLSSNGVFIEIPQKVVRGDLIRLSFPLPGQEREIGVRSACVVWTGAMQEDGPQGAGISFLTVELEARRLIARYVKDQMDETTPARAGNRGIEYCRW